VVEISRATKPEVPEKARGFGQEFADADSAYLLFLSPLLLKAFIYMSQTENLV
jgi:hypothetical protein